MPEKSQKRKLRSDPSSSLENVESTSQASDENTCLTEQDFSDISNKIENRLSKRLRDAEFGQREILKLIENLAAKVDGLSNSATEPSGSILRHDIEPESIGNSEPTCFMLNNFEQICVCLTQLMFEYSLNATGNASKMKQLQQTSKNYYHWQVWFLENLNGGR